MPYCRIFLSEYKLPEMKANNIVTLIVDGKLQKFKASYSNKIFPDKFPTLTLVGVSNASFWPEPTIILNDIESEPGANTPDNNKLDIDTSNLIITPRKKNK